MLLLLIQAGNGLFSSIQTSTHFLLTQFELFFSICCRSWMNSIWCRVRVKRRIWETKIMNNKAKSRGAGMAFSLSHLVIVMPPCGTAFLMTQSGRLNLGGHTAAVRILMHRQFVWEILTTPGMSSDGRVFKVLYLEDQKMRNNLFWWLNFRSLWNTSKSSLSFLNPGLSFSTWLFLNGEQHEAAVLSLSVAEGWMVVWLQLTQLAHLSWVITGHGYMWRRNQKWRQIVFKIASTLNTRKRKPNMLFLWSRQFHNYWGKICSFCEKKTEQHEGKTKVGNKIACRRGRSV